MIRADSFVAIDLEAVARTPVEDSVLVEVGAVRFIDGEVVETHQSFVDAGANLPSSFTIFTGIEEAHLLGAPTVLEAYEALAEFVGDDVIVAHNGTGFDFPILDRLAQELDRSSLPANRVDTLLLAHLVYPRVGSPLPGRSSEPRPSARSLNVLGDHLQLSVDGDAHRAGRDATLCGLIYLEMLSALNAGTSVSSLQRWLLAQAGPLWPQLLAIPDDPPRLVEVIPPQPVIPPTPTTGRFDPDAAVKPLQPGGELITASREYRPDQEKMARQIVDAFVSNGRAIIDAPTGIGKTFAYLVPARAWAQASGECVMVAPNTKVLQSQVAAALVELGDVTWTVLKGLNNYVDLEALQDLLDESEKLPDVATALAVVVGWLSDTPVGDWEDLETLALRTYRDAFDEIVARCSLDSDPGPPESELDLRCFYRHASAALEFVDVAVVNHAVLTTRTDLGERTTRVIVDEAHELEDAATSAYSEEVAQRRFSMLRRMVWNPPTRSGVVPRLVRATHLTFNEKAIEMVRAAMDAVDRTSSGFGPVVREFAEAVSGVDRSTLEQYGVQVRTNQGAHLERHSRQTVRDAGKELQLALLRVADALDAITVPADVRRPFSRKRLEMDIARAGRTCREWATTIDDVVWSAEPDHWIAIVGVASLADGGGWVLRRVPLSVAEELAHLWNAFDSVIATSATMIVGGKFDYFLRRLGIGTATPLRLSSPFSDHRHQHLMVLTDHLPAPRQDRIREFIAAERGEIAKFVAAANGRTLALFTARSRMVETHDAAQPILEELGYSVAIQGSAPASTLLEDMRTNRFSSLFALKSFWQGVDIPGEALSQLIIEKVPFESPADPVVAARSELIELSGEDSFIDYIVPRAAVSFAQGVGRLIRSVDDRGVTVVLDSRLRRPVSYRETILGRLPETAVITRPSEASEAYECVAEHLGVSLDDSVLDLIERRTAPAIWAELRELELTEEQVSDEGMIIQHLERVRSLLGFEAWTSEQLRIMVDFIQNRDVFAVLPTGAGKSITFQVPALLLPGITVVVSPLVALIRDQVRQLGDAGLQMVGALYSGQSSVERADILRGAQSGRYRLIYVSPERLWSPEFRAALASVGVRRLVVDEAHCISQWGQSFRTEYSSIPKAIEAVAGARRPAILAATATASPRVAAEIRESLNLELVDGPIVGNPDRPEIHYHVHQSKDGVSRDIDVLRMIEAFARKAAIVYVPKRAVATRLANMLRLAGHNVASYHGGLPQERRKSVEERFLYGDLDVVVGTKAFGLGVNKDDIALIVHYEMPASIEEFIQETGRLARGAIWGQEPSVGTSILITTPKDCSIHKYFIRNGTPDVDLVEAIPSSLVDGPNFVPLRELAKTHDKDELQVELALYYLFRAGVVDLGPDRAWRARVVVPPDADEVLGSASMGDEKLSKRVLRFAKQRQEYAANEWSEALKISIDQLEDTILELQRSDVLGFYPWAFAKTIIKNPGSLPNRRHIEKLVNERRELMTDLSVRARAYAHSYRGCRRRPLLEYLGVDAPETCTGCDHCVPLDKPWDSIGITVNSLLESMPSQRVVQQLVRDAGIYGYSEAKYINCLVGEAGYGGRSLPEVLANAPAFGVFKLFGREAAKTAIQDAVDNGLIEREERAYNGHAYVSLRTPIGER